MDTDLGTVSLKPKPYFNHPSGNRTFDLLSAYTSSFALSLWKVDDRHTHVHTQSLDTYMCLFSFLFQQFSSLMLFFSWLVMLTAARAWRALSLLSEFLCLYSLWSLGPLLVICTEFSISIGVWWELRLC